MRTRLPLATLLTMLALLAVPVAASAHPLGGFDVNHLVRVSVSTDRVDVRYIVTDGEFPTFQERGVPDATRLARKRREVERRLVVTVDGRRVALRPAGPATITHPVGGGGLATTRVELPLSAKVQRATRVEVRDGTFPGRVGWKAIVAQPGRGTAVRSSVPASDPSDGLRGDPGELPLTRGDVQTARLDVAPGAGTLEAPDGQRLSRDGARTGDGLTRVFESAAAGHGVLVLLLLAGFGWGAVHAVSPGHGKAMVAAYLVGTRGRPRHAVALGLMVTLTHTIGVFALGAVALALSQYVLPETLFPWLNLVSGLLVVGVGAAVLRGHLRRLRAGRHGHAHDHHHGHEHHHGHDHGHGHSHLPQAPGVRGLVVMGAAAGLIPCPSALVVLLGAVSQGQIALGMLLIVAFSAGLAATLTALGLAVVLASRAVRTLRVPGRVVSGLPAVSAVLIVVVGCVLTANAIPLVS